jgi:hypothetical protein
MTPEPVNRDSPSCENTPLSASLASPQPEMVSNVKTDYDYNIQKAFFSLILERFSTYSALHLANALHL